ncbi:N-acetylglucosamine kinase [Sporosarcina aquimarina]|uniref:BadF/BadG/BcrA/BcrD ATPase family protein n=1 Tax=Sporosarcina aquimarina TaxID=114975 RepID=A0ABU4G0W3_9BACL|nr:BadF/BadG/BcrA/BcrD ATPase family protein [Sporosarcina aquimarina]MDW0110581.1 BadF/BadG/BcrA/BcrD ATPase family protein [Sporosarcina aquimarina]
MTRHILAVDGGGTKTALVLCDENGVKLYETASDGSNYQAIGQAALRRVLTSALMEIFAACPVPSIDVAVFALAGVNTEKDRNTVTFIIQDILNSMQLNVADLVIENDAFGVLKGLVHEQPGVLAICGTGAIAFAQDEHQHIIRSSGWGHRIGDGGSACWMGTKVIDAVFRMDDGRGRKTVLKDKTLSAMGFTTVEQLFNWVNGDQYSIGAVGKLTIQLSEAESEKDPVASEIVANAVAELVSMVEAVIHRSKLQDVPCTVFCAGGTIQNFDALFERVKNTIETRQPNKTVIRTDESPIDIVIKRAMNLMDKTE